jgi:hypothetical protein
MIFRINIIFVQGLSNLTFVVNKLRRPVSEPLFTIRIQPPGELTPKFGEIARPDRLPHASHGVKEEGQIMVRQ